MVTRRILVCLLVVSIVAVSHSVVQAKRYSSAGPGMPMAGSPMMQPGYPPAGPPPMYGMPGCPPPCPPPVCAPQMCGMPACPPPCPPPACGPQMCGMPPCPPPCYDPCKKCDFDPLGSLFSLLAAPFRGGSSSCASNKCMPMCMPMYMPPCPPQPTCAPPVVKCKPTGMRRAARGAMPGPMPPMPMR